MTRRLPPRRRRRLALALASPLMITPLLTPLLAGPAEAAAGRQIRHAAWDSRAELSTGTRQGVVVDGGTLRMGTPVARVDGYDQGTWTSPWVESPFGATELIPSWKASTPGDTRVQVEVRARTATVTSSFDTLADYTLDDAERVRRSGTGQGDDLGWVAYDTWLAHDAAGVTGWQVRVTLHRRSGTSASPSVGMVGAMASRLPSARTVTTSRPGAAGGAALGRVLDVPRYSQMVHSGAYPQYGGGGQAWCSPTSTAMVMSYYDRLPVASNYAWVDPDMPDRFVPHLARMTFDHAFDGTGNWAFNTAYAAQHVGRGFVTRLPSLRGAERYIAADIPVVASITFGAGELTGAPISATDGHLLVIVGFTRSGDVVVNDPAASGNAGVRRTYDRAEFENAWLKRYLSDGRLRGSGGVAYVIHDRRHPLP